MFRLTTFHLIMLERREMKDERDELLEIARRVVRCAREQAEVAEVSIGSSWDLSAKVRLGSPELVEEAGQRGLSLRVIREGRVAMTSSSDLTEEGLALLVRDAISLSELSEPDPFVGPLPKSELAQGPFADLDLFDPEVSKIDAKLALDLAVQAERAALSFDPRITLSEGATLARSESCRAMVLSDGFEGTSRGTYASVSVVPVVMDAGEKRRRGYYYSARRHFQDLEDLKFVGEEAARRTLQKLGARKVKTGEAPVIFDADSARSLLSTFAGVILGGAIWRKSSYLVDRVGTQVSSPLISIVDDPLIPKAPGSRAFDGEGMASRVNQVVEDGVLKSYLLDAYSARKLGLGSTASAARSGGSIGPSTTNLMIRPGSNTKEAIIEQTERGLLVTEMMGFGFNPVTGDFSRGAAGFWIENGKIAYPVSEVTISSSLDRMLKGVDRLGNDFEWKSSIASPSLRIESMTISGS